jgi:hypothetical protein
MHFIKKNSLEIQFTIKIRKRRGHGRRVVLVEESSYRREQVAELRHVEAHAALRAEMDCFDDAGLCSRREVLRLPAALCADSYLAEAAKTQRLYASKTVSMLCLSVGHA